MRARSLLLSLCLLPASLMSIAADSTDCTAIAAGVTGCAQTAWLAGCDSAEAGKVWIQLQHGAVPLSLDAPTESYTSGAGCGTPEEPVGSGAGTGNPFYDLNVQGYFETDNPGSLTVELHDIFASRGRTSGIVPLSVKIEVDGVSLFGTEEFTSSVDGSTEMVAKAVNVDVPTIRSATGASELLSFTVVDLHERFPELFTADGAGDGYTDVIVSVSVRDNGGHAFVWGAAEIASNLRINGPDAELKIEAGTGRPRR